MVVKSDEDVDGYGDGDRGDLPSSYARLPLPLQLHSPYYFILTASYSPNTDSNTQHHNAYHASHNPLDNSLSDNTLHHAHDNADKHGLHHAQAVTALSPL